MNEARTEATRDLRRSVRRFLAIVGVLVAAVVFGLAVYLVPLALSGYIVTTRGSLAYHVFMDSEAIRGVPVVEAVGEEEFIYDWGDGPAPCSVAVQYRTRASVKDVRDRVEAYLKEAGYLPDMDRSDDVERIWTRGRDFIMLRFDTSDGWCRVTVREYTP